MLNLLCQRTVQTQIDYYRSFKNDFATDWLVRFSEQRMGCRRLYTSRRGSSSGGYLHYHKGMGVAAWDKYLLGVMGAPVESHEVRVVWGSRLGGGSPENPYLPKKKARTYTDSIYPAKVARQLISIRETLAEEWTDDLGLIQYDNIELRRHHDEEVKNLVDDQERFQCAIRPDECGKDGSGSSPLRIASYDLLKNAVTLHALLMLIEEQDANELQRHQAKWLRTFGKTHATGLQGDNGWHVARDVVYEMMNQPVSVRKSPRGKPQFIDPLGLADRLLELRAELSSDWIEELRQVPNHHLGLARQRLVDTGIAMTREDKNAMAREDKKKKS